MDKPILNEKEKMALMMGDPSLIVSMNGETADEAIEKKNIKDFNNQVDQYVEKFEQHSTNLKDFAERVNANVNSIEIMPIANYLLVKQFEENPFQRIVRDSNSGLILDLGGLKPEYKNTDNGEIEEEEQFIKVGVIQEVGPECKWCIPGDTVFYTKPSAVPVPFYKQQLILVNENRILAVVNEGLSERMKKNE